MTIYDNLKRNLAPSGDRGFTPGHGRIVYLDDVDPRKKPRAKKSSADETGAFYVVVGLPEFEASILHAFSLAVDKACCVRCSDKECEERDGSCWEYE